jgi:hypothetical protein
MTRNGIRKALKLGAMAVATLVALAACGHLVMMMRGTDAERPAESEFGYGPRESGAKLYEATIEPVQPLRTRRMQTVKLAITREGVPVDNATITVDGGMPEHGHGLPTTPRVTRSLGGGVYQVDGVRFNMGGWWELKFRIASAAGADSVTFNLDL